MGKSPISKISSVALWYLERLHMACYRRQLIFYCRHAGERPNEPGVPEGYDIRFLEPADLDRLHYPGGWLPLAEAQQWLRRGDSDMLAAVRDGCICAYAWVERKIARIDYLKLNSPLPEGHIYVSKVLVVPEHRKRGLARAMYGRIEQAYPAATAHSACIAENLPMHLLFGSLGWTPRLLLWVWQVGPFHWYGMENIGGGSRLLLTRSSTPQRLFLDAGNAAFLARTQREGLRS
jgi:GNAT superfamily N-acetyltransferase